MANYEKPLVILNNEMFEGVYALESGIDPSAWGTIEWSNHNSGSHSDLSLHVYTKDGVPGQRIKITVTFIGKGNLTWGGFSDPWGGCEITTANKTVTIVKVGNINGNSNFQFSLNNIVFTATGDNHDTSVHKGSYYETNTHIGDASGDFDISIEYS